ncbi:MAG: S8 family serine peptidase [Paracoccus sp. (in: a-proteobacteria)]
MLKLLCKLWIVLALAVGGMVPLGDGGTPLLAGAALADDDDDDDDARDDDDDDRVIRRARPRIRQAPPPRVARIPRPGRAPDEIVAPRLEQQDFQSLLDQGFTLIEAYQRPDDSIARRLRIPEGSTLPAARQAVRDLPTGQQADFNHYYRTEQAATVTRTAATSLPACRGKHCADRRLIGWSHDTARVQSCLGDVTIGLIDTGLNEDHATFGRAELDVIRLTPERQEPSQAIHGTAVAALLIGDPASRSPGLVPGARVIAVDAFYRVRGDERADVFTLIKGLTQLAENGADVINLSLAGPPNTALKQAIDRLTREENIIIIAAVGNAGAKARPLFPAAYGQVIGVTAVDRELRVYRRAVNGAHVDLAAPGVDVWTAASISGIRPKTGTSFAVPFVTAAVAMLRGQNPDLTGAQALRILAAEARDLGEPGRDPVFGAGLISTASVCAG